MPLLDKLERRFGFLGIPGLMRIVVVFNGLVFLLVRLSPAFRFTLDLDPERIRRESDPSDLMEGLYLKVEEEGQVKARYKYVRADFLTAVVDSGTHWLRRPIVPNMVAAE